MKLIITVDAEEDNWGEFDAENFTVGNIEQIPVLQDLFDSFAVKPTYLISYPVAMNDRAVSILKSILMRGDCEIGSHCHPWNTPPIKEPLDERHSMLCNLPSGLQYEKILNLHNAIQKNFNITPTSFRSGRWGFSSDVARNIHRLGYKVDTSVTAFTDWTKYFGPDYSHISPEPYRFSVNNIYEESSKAELFQVPATVGYSQRNFMLVNRIYKAMVPLKKLRVNGILHRLKLVNKIYLSPEMSQGKEMIKLIQRMIKSRFRYLNMAFHSASLKPGLTPFVSTESESIEFIKKIRDCLVYLRDNGIDSITLSEAEEFYKKEL